MIALLPRLRTLLRPVHLVAAVLALTLIGEPVAGGADAALPPSVVLIGVDGAEWKVVKRLWKRGELPALRALAERGVSAELETAYGARSPIVWTTVATGHTMETHGIDDFLASAAGRHPVPVSSSDRRVRALWNLLTELQRPVLVLGWWASWPVEEIEGLMISDRIFRPQHERTIWPPDLEKQVAGWAEASRRAYGELYSTEWYGKYDALMAWVARRELEARRYDLSLIYFHSTDIVSHRYWKYVEPEKFPPSSERDRAEHGQTVYDAYRAVDRSIADILAVVGEDARVLLISDHGFEAAEAETVEVGWRAAPVLEAAGFWKGQGEAPDWTATRAYDHRSKMVDSRKEIRINVKGREPSGIVPPEQISEVIEALSAALSRFRFKSSGKPTFRIEKPGPDEDADLIVDINRKRAEDIDTDLLYEGRVIAGAIQSPRFVSGEHKGEPPGIFLAAGPGIRRGALLEKATIFEIAPTVLYMLDLPYGEDMAGTPLLGIFTEDYVAKHAPRTIPTWERSEWRPAKSTPSAADEEILEQLRALGYIP